jgi:hypothetical protein
MNSKKSRGTNQMNTKKRILPIISILFLASIACNALFPKKITPGSLEEQIAEGDIRFVGSGNVTYIGCQDPTAAVSVYIGPKSKELDGVKYNTYVNPVTVNAITDGSQIKVEECQKTSLGEKYDWPAKGIYYADEEKIIFYTCTQNNHKAEGQAYLVGEGFEGEYACYDNQNGGLMYEVAISAYEISK